MFIFDCIISISYSNISDVIFLQVTSLFSLTHLFFPQTTHFALYTILFAIFFISLFFSFFILSYYRTTFPHSIFPFLYFVFVYYFVILYMLFFLGYFQLQANPGLWILNLAAGRGAKLFSIGKYISIFSASITLSFCQTVLSLFCFYFTFSFCFHTNFRDSFL